MSFDRHSQPCDGYTFWTNGPPPAPYPSDACGVCGWPEGGHGNNPRLLDAAEAVREARVRYAQHFLRFRVRAKSDGQAHQQAIVETDDELTILEARLELAKRDLDRPWK